MEKVFIQQFYNHSLRSGDIDFLFEKKEINTMETVQLYIAGIFTASEAVNRLRYNKVNNQVSFHTSKALKYVRLIRRTAYDGKLHI